MAYEVTTSQRVDMLRLLLYIYPKAHSSLT